MNDLIPFHEAVGDARREHRLLISWARSASSLKTRDAR